jgi:hypothetical protein
VPDGGPDAPDATPAGLREENARPNPTVVVAIDEWLWPLSVTRWDQGVHLSRTSRPRRREIRSRCLKRRRRLCVHGD